MKPRFNLGKRVIVPTITGTIRGPYFKSLTVKEIMKLIIEDKLKLKVEPPERDK